MNLGSTIMIFSLFLYLISKITSPYAPTALDNAVDNNIFNLKEMESQNAVLNENLKNWELSGEYFLYRHFKIFYVDLNKEEKDVILFIHGFPSSSYDYRDVVGEISGKRIVIFDFPGFGLSDKPSNFTYSLMEYADVALTFWKAIGIKRAHIVSHDMGDSVLTELLYRRENGLLPSTAPDFESVTFTNGGMRIELGALRITQKLIRTPVIGEYITKLMVLTSYKGVELSLRSLHLENETALSNENITDMISLIRYKNGYQRMSSIGRYIDERYQHQPKWLDSLSRLDIPCHLVWGKQDSVAPITIAEKLISDTLKKCQFSILDNEGHFLMIENPTIYRQTISSFITRLHK